MDIRFSKLCDYVINVCNKHYTHSPQFRLEVNYSAFDTLWNGNGIMILGTNPGDSTKIEKANEGDFYPHEESQRYQYTKQKIGRMQSKYRTGANGMEVWTKWHSVSCLLEKPKSLNMFVAAVDRANHS